MKKKKLKNLALNRKTISNLDASQSRGGNTTNSVQVCIRTYVNANGINICIATADCARTEGKECQSIFNDCITQTEFPTCRNCQ
ncbi:class I lanthipeptide [Kordia algicida OT-1]|uniref:Uncharacterized protein n=1 Tax=Kordia algicida OT-1 TaxID=391587 RepID=A9DJF3_9FLAO|nr:class I lanthipeptide [Kordia algicida]EDP98090.1 hypothetical protein KAOT1_12772 [Kordia algicida OT-1]